MQHVLRCSRRHLAFSSSPCTLSSLEIVLCAVLTTLVCQNPAFSATQIRSLAPIFWEKAVRVR